MAIDGLTIIGESINDSIRSTHELLEAGNVEGIKALAASQDQAGAAYIDVNVGPRPPQFLADLISQVQSVTAKPLSIDTPDPAQTHAGLRAYDPARAGGRMPVVNSISTGRMEMFDLLSVRPFMPILLVSERHEGGQGLANRTAEETYETARAMLAAARRHGLPNEQLIIDPAIAPIGSDTEGNFKRLLGALRLMHEDPDFAGVHRSVGLSNFTVMLPPKRADGSPVKSALENAFLTRAMPLGLDMVIGSTKRKYQLLAEGDPALACLDEVLQMDGFDALLRVREFYT